MNLDFSTFAFGYQLEHGGGNPNWATSLGQGKEYKINNYPEISDLLKGMVYSSISLDSVSMRIGKGGKKYFGNDPESLIVLAAMFTRVFVNNEAIKEGRYILAITRDDSQSHFGRLRLKYGTGNALNSNGKEVFTNQELIERIRNHFGLAESACWFVSQLNIVNQNELHLTAHFIDKSKTVSYADSAAQHHSWDPLIGADKCSTPVLVNQSSPYLAPYLAAIRTKPFLLLAGISGTGKSRLVRELAWRCCPDALAKDKYGSKRKKPGNYELVQVRPNWHDSMDLMGHVSRISGTPKFVVTDFVMFLAKAWLYRDVPFFLCLDEMNLAPVEQYFAEYLSVIETREKVADGSIETDVPVKLDREIIGEVLDNLFAEEKHGKAAGLIEKFKSLGGIPIPQNFIVIGTVNMDETTFSFSRKVLDRAMSFELNDPDLAANSCEVSEVERFGDPKAIAIGEICGGSDIEEKSETWSEVVTKLGVINGALADTPFRIAYRSRNEIALYVHERCRDGAAFARAFDEAVSLKILSRIEGNSDRIRAGFLAALRDKIDECVGYGDSEKSEGVCHMKLTAMKDALEREDYCSFWSC